MKRLRTILTQFKLVEYVLLDDNNSEMDQSHMTGNI